MHFPEIEKKAAFFMDRWRRELKEGEHEDLMAVDEEGRQQDSDAGNPLFLTSDPEPEKEAEGEHGFFIVGFIDVLNK